MKLRKTPVQGRALFGLKTRICKISAKLSRLFPALLAGVKPLLLAQSVTQSVGRGKRLLYMDH